LSASRSFLVFFGFAFPEKTFLKKPSTVESRLTTEERTAMTALFTAPLPALIVLLYRWPMGYGLGLLLVTALPMVIAWRMDGKESAAAQSLLVYPAVMTLALCIALLGLRPLYQDAGLPAWLAEWATGWVMKHPQRTQLLYQAMSSGLLPVPEGFSNFTLLTLTINPVFLHQLELEMHARFLSLIRTSIPSLVVEGGMIIGLFTALRVQKLRNAYLLVDRENPQKVRIALTPSFSMLRIPKGWNWKLLLFLIFYLLFYGSGGVLSTMAVLLRNAFETLYQLQGAAVICAWLMRQDEDRRTLAGIAAAALYLLVPMALFIIGCFHYLFPSRTQTEDDNNDEREKHEEEEP
jgi:hypothetical protein